MNDPAVPASKLEELVKWCEVGATSLVYDNIAKSLFRDMAIQLRALISEVREGVKLCDTCGLPEHNGLHGMGPNLHAFTHGKFPPVFAGTEATPNALTRRVMEETETGKNLVTFDSPEKMFRELDAGTDPDGEENRIGHGQARPIRTAGTDGLRERIEVIAEMFRGQCGEPGQISRMLDEALKDTREGEKK